MFYKVNQAIGFQLEEVPYHHYDHVNQTYSGLIISILDGSNETELGFIARINGTELSKWQVRSPGQYNIECSVGWTRIHDIAEFLELIRVDYPDDFDMFLFHPEIFQGRFIQ